ncbi:(2Fe-2S)-binding protein [Mesorhizobium sp.]|uniref:(2Fe-2S)-binding protein n=1 Tax=Mesorhizobium sp. TaxID=1871066 RepID=UPI000FE3D750|nr:(2Fe-2S)-binding protein [Mesorhizobium sp.]RWH69325.1 MAG: (2Fe-2S)-binding protein [Mesorhizobium sp.]RWL27812.1 MAG: (2Fe-2S)-binding protein [Mesorhizobium sp.]RWL29121.1 MAG: (2Fe-2S)-binding protein [Mesorhizobium sp.]RWL37287.1 MAG: (2Fe-2S)-binding protein [Mesorhizobium sp.]RWL55622.1 MAG: (2Fe-2S)-binding protein [Mesorhizobium sp.]
MTQQNKPASSHFPLYRLLSDAPGGIVVDLDGEQLAAHSHETVASLMLRQIDPGQFRRSAVSGEPRAPLCMMGVCFECLVEIDGQRNEQACLVRVRSGMTIRRQFPRGERQ